MITSSPSPLLDKSLVHMFIFFNVLKNKGQLPFTYSLTGTVSAGRNYAKKDVVAPNCCNFGTTCDDIQFVVQGRGPVNNTYSEIWNIKVIVHHSFT